MTDSIILVHYIPKEEKWKERVDEIKTSLKDQWEAGKCFMYFIPTDSEMRVECINPKLVDAKAYEKANQSLQKTQKIIDKLAEKGKSLL